MAKRIAGYIKLSYTEGKALLDFINTNNLPVPRELCQCLVMIDEYFNPKPAQITTAPDMVETVEESE